MANMEIMLTGEEKKALQNGAKSITHTKANIGFVVALDENGRPQVVALEPSDKINYSVCFPGYSLTGGIIERK